MTGDTYIKRRICPSSAEAQHRRKWKAESWWRNKVLAICQAAPCLLCNFLSQVFIFVKGRSTFVVKHEWPSGHNKYKLSMITLHHTKSAVTIYAY